MTVVNLLKLDDQSSELAEGEQLANKLNRARQSIVRSELYRDMLVEYVARNVANDARQDAGSDLD